MADKGEELVKYIAGKVIHFMDTPKEERRRSRKLRHSKEAWLSRWFGVVPFALSMWLEQRKKKHKGR
jgi:ribonuclease PH